MKNLFKISLIQDFFALIIFCYINFVRYSGLWKKVNLDKTYDSINKKSVIYIFWHGKMMMMPYLPIYRESTNILISPHRDGRLIAKVMKFFKFKIIEGSTNKNSFKALKTLLSKLNLNESVVITPDGPRGPARKINSNLLYIAYKSQKPIIPMSFIAKNFITFNSWDSFYLAYPFNRGILLTGKIFNIENDDKEYLERKAQEIEEELNNLGHYKN